MVIRPYLYKVSDVLAKLDVMAIERVVGLIQDAQLVLTCGNGGSAATAIHFASDLRSLGYPAFDLLSPSKYTQIDNDSGHSHPFREQAANFPEALIVAFSGSGTSKNIVTLAYDSAERMVLFSSEMRKFNYPGVYVIKVPSDDYEVIEDAHLAICHAIKKELKRRGKD
jgi:D-sedoheptulose 7-phosphate isomerase